MNFSIIFLLGSQLADAGAYAPEIIALRERERTYVQVSQDKLLALQGYMLAYERLSSTMQRLGDPSGPHKVADFSGLNLSASRKAILSIASEQARAEVFLKDLDIIRPALDEAIKTLRQIVKEDLPELAESTEKSIDGIETQLTRAKEAFALRRTETERLSKQWVEWQVDVAIKLKIEDRKAVLGDLTFADGIQQINSTARLARSRALDYLEVGQVEFAREILSGLVWLHSNTPAFFAGALVSRERVDKMNSLLRGIEQTEDELAESISAYVLAQERIEHHLHTSLERGPLLVAGQARLAYDSTKFKKTPDSPSPSDHVLNGTASFELGNREVQIKESPTFQKQVFSYEDSHQDSGFAKVYNQKIRDAIPMERGTALADRIRREAADLLKPPSERPQSPRPPPDEKLPQKLDHLRDMMKEPRPPGSSAPSAEDQAEENELKSDIERFREQTQIFQKEVSEMQGRANGAQNAASQKAQGAADSARINGAKLSIPGPGEGADPDQSASDAAELSKIIADFTLGIIPGFGNAYNAAGFFSSLLYHQSLLGQPTTNTDTLLLGAAAILPFLPMAVQAAKVAVLSTKFRIESKIFMNAARTRSVATATNKAAFWSGITATEAAERAGKLGMTTLEQTPAGRYLDAKTIFERKGWKGIKEREAEAKKIWDTVGKRYAQAASGDTVAFEKTRTVQKMEESTFRSTELPALKENPKITSIKIIPISP